MKLLGVGAYQGLAQKILCQKRAQEFHIDGSWADPKITKVERPK